jgi:hypothetical protein
LSNPQRFFTVSIKLRVKSCAWTAEPAFSAAFRLGAAAAGWSARAPAETTRDKTSIRRYLRLNISLLPKAEPDRREPFLVHLLASQAMHDLVYIARYVKLLKCSPGLPPPGKSEGLFGGREYDDKIGHK